MKKLVLFIGLVGVLLALNCCGDRKSNSKGSLTYTTAQLQSILDKSVHSQSGIYNIMDYGAKGDGITDDYTAIAAAITAASTNGGTIRVPKGLFIFGTSLTILNPNIIFRGDGHDASILKYTGTGSAITIGAGTDYQNTVGGISFNDLTIKGQANTVNGIVLQNASTFSMSNCVISDFGGCGIITGTDSWSNIFVNTSFKRNGVAGFKMASIVNLNTFIGCYFIENPSTGLYITGTIRNCVFISCDWTGSQYGILSDANYLEGCSFQSCWFEANTSRDIKILSLNSSKIAGCKFSSQLSSNIEINSLSYSSVIEGNTGIVATDATILITQYCNYGSVIKNNRWYPHHIKLITTYYDADTYSSELNQVFSSAPKLNKLLIKAADDAGYILFNDGDATHPGFISFHKADNTRVGFLGYNNSGMYLAAEGNGVFRVVGNITPDSFDCYGGVRIRDNGYLYGSPVMRGDGSFSTTATSVDIAISGATVNDFYTVSWKGTVAAGDGNLSYTATATGITVTRSAGTTSGATFTWMRMK